MREFIACLSCGERRFALTFASSFCPSGICVMSSFFSSAVISVRSFWIASEVIVAEIPGALASLINKVRKIGRVMITYNLVSTVVVLSFVA